MSWVSRLFIFLLIFSLSAGVQAQKVKRLGVIDIEADSLTPEERQQILTSLKAALNDQRLFALVRDQEVEAKLVQKNKSKSDLEKIKAEHESKLAQFQHHFDEGQKLFRASNFDEAIQEFETAIPMISDASLVISASVVHELFEFLGAAHYFAGNEVQARTYFAAILDLDPLAMINVQKFPPPIVELFKTVKAESRFALTPWVFESSTRGLEIQMAGQPLSVTEGEKITVLVPQGHPLWGTMNILVAKDGFAPALFAAAELPKEVKLTSLRDRRLVTRGLFSPLGATTPPMELKKLVVNLDLSVVFLGSANKDLEGRWLLKGQWLEGATSRTSPISQSSDVQLNTAVKNLVADLLGSVDSEGRVVATKPSAAPSDYQVIQETSQASPPFYKTWWFWSLVGVGAAGIGAGTYYLLSPSESLKVKVVQAQ